MRKQVQVRRSEVLKEEKGGQGRQSLNCSPVLGL
jgi:hypothetical protein